MSRPDWITAIKWWDTEKKGRGPAGKGGFTIADAIFVQFTIWENDGTYSVSLPRKENPNFDPSKDIGKGNQKYFEDAGCVSSTVREEMTRCLVDALLEQRSNSPNVPSTDTDEIPF